MEVQVVNSENVPDGCLLSLSAGGSRRQAPLVQRQKFAFSSSSAAAAVAAGGNGLKVEVLSVQGTARVPSSELTPALLAGLESQGSGASGGSSHRIEVPVEPRAGASTPGSEATMRVGLNIRAVQQGGGWETSRLLASGLGSARGSEDTSSSKEQDSSSITSSVQTSSLGGQMKPPLLPAAAKPHGAHGPPAHSTPRSSRRHHVALEARSYLEDHCILPFVEKMLRTLVQDRPADPWGTIRTMLPHGVPPAADCQEALSGQPAKLASPAEPTPFRLLPSVGTWYLGRPTARFIASLAREAEARVAAEEEASEAAATPEDEPREPASTDTGTVPDEPTDAVPKQAPSKPSLLTGFHGLGKQRAEVQGVTAIGFVLERLDYDKVLSSPELCVGLLRQLQEAIARKANVHPLRVEVDISRGSVCVSAAIRCPTLLLAEEAKALLDAGYADLLESAERQILAVPGIQDAVAGSKQGLGLRGYTSSVKAKLMPLEDAASFPVALRQATSSTLAPDHADPWLRTISTTAAQSAGNSFVHPAPVPRWQLSGMSEEVEDIPPIPSAMEASSGATSEREVAILASALSKPEEAESAWADQPGSAAGDQVDSFAEDLPGNSSAAAGLADTHMALERALEAAEPLPQLNEALEIASHQAAVQEELSSALLEASKSGRVGGIFQGLQQEATRPDVQLKRSLSSRLAEAAKEGSLGGIIQGLQEERPEEQKASSPVKEVVEAKEEGAAIEEAAPPVLPIKEAHEVVGSSRAAEKAAPPAHDRLEQEESGSSAEQAAPPSGSVLADEVEVLEPVAPEPSLVVECLESEHPEESEALRRRAEDTKKALTAGVPKLPLQLKRSANWPKDITPEEERMVATKLLQQCVPQVRFRQDSMTSAGTSPMLSGVVSRAPTTTLNSSRAPTVVDSAGSWMSGAQQPPARELAIVEALDPSPAVNDPRGSVAAESSPAPAAAPSTEVATEVVPFELPPAADAAAWTAPSEPVAAASSLVTTSEVLPFSGTVLADEVEVQELAEPAVAESMATNPMTSAPSSACMAHTELETVERLAVDNAPIVAASVQAEEAALDSSFVSVVSSSRTSATEVAAAAAAAIQEEAVRAFPVVELDLEHLQAPVAEKASTREEQPEELVYTPSEDAGKSRQTNVEAAVAAEEKLPAAPSMPEREVAKEESMVDAPQPLKLQEEAVVLNVDVPEVPPDSAASLAGSAEPLPSPTWVEAGRLTQELSQARPFSAAVESTGAGSVTYSVSELTPKSSARDCVDRVTIAALRSERLPSRSSVASEVHGARFGVPEELEVTLSPHRSVATASFASPTSAQTTSSAREALRAAESAKLHEAAAVPDVKGIPEQEDFPLNGERAPSKATASLADASSVLPDDALLEAAPLLPDPVEELLAASADAKALPDIAGKTEVQSVAGFTEPSPRTPARQFVDGLAASALAAQHQPSRASMSLPGSTTVAHQELQIHIPDEPEPDEASTIAVLEEALLEVGQAKDLTALAVEEPVPVLHEVAESAALSDATEEEAGATPAAKPPAAEVLLPEIEAVRDVRSAEGGESLAAFTNPSPHSSARGFVDGFTATALAARRCSSTGPQSLASSTVMALEPHAADPQPTNTKALPDVMLQDPAEVDTAVFCPTDASPHASLHGFMDCVAATATSTHRSAAAATPSLLSATTAPARPEREKAVETATLEKEATQEFGDLALRSPIAGTVVAEEISMEELERLLPKAEMRSEGSEALCAKTQEELASLSFSIEGLEYPALCAEPHLLASFREKMCEVVAAGAGVEPEHVELTLSAGSTVVHARIRAPVGWVHDPEHTLDRQQASNEALAARVLEEVASLAGIGKVCSSPLAVVKFQVPAFSGKELPGLRPSTQSSALPELPELGNRQDHDAVSATVSMLTYGSKDADMGSLLPQQQDLAVSSAASASATDVAGLPSAEELLSAPATVPAPLASPKPEVLEAPAVPALLKERPQEADAAKLAGGVIAHAVKAEAAARTADTLPPMDLQERQSQTRPVSRGTEVMTRPPTRESKVSIAAFTPPRTPLERVMPGSKLESLMGGSSFAGSIEAYPSMGTKGSGTPPGRVASKCAAAPEALSAPNKEEAALLLPVREAKGSPPEEKAVVVPHFDLHEPAEAASLCFTERSPQSSACGLLDGITASALAAQRRPSAVAETLASAASEQPTLLKDAVPSQRKASKSASLISAASEEERSQKPLPSAMSPRPASAASGPSVQEDAGVLSRQPSKASAATAVGPVPEVTAQRLPSKAHSRPASVASVPSRQEDLAPAARMPSRRPSVASVATVLEPVPEALPLVSVALSQTSLASLDCGGSEASPQSSACGYVDNITASALAVHRRPSAASQSMASAPSEQPRMLQENALSHQHTPDAHSLASAASEEQVSPAQDAIAAAALRRPSVASQALVSEASEQPHRPQEEAAPQEEACADTAEKGATEAEAPVTEVLQRSASSSEQMSATSSEVMRPGLQVLPPADSPAPLSLVHRLSCTEGSPASSARGLVDAITAMALVARRPSTCARSVASEAPLLLEELAPAQPSQPALSEATQSAWDQGQDSVVVLEAAAQEKGKELVKDALEKATAPLIAEEASAATRPDPAACGSQHELEDGLIGDKAAPCRGTPSPISSASAVQEPQPSPGVEPPSPSVAAQEAAPPVLAAAAPTLSGTMSSLDWEEGCSLPGTEVEAAAKESSSRLLAAAVGAAKAARAAIAAPSPIATQAMEEEEEAQLRLPTPAPLADSLTCCQTDRSPYSAAQGLVDNLAAAACRPQAVPAGETPSLVSATSVPEAAVQPLVHLEALNSERPYGTPLTEVAKVFASEHLPKVLLGSAGSSSTGTSPMSSVPTTMRASHMTSQMEQDAFSSGSLACSDMQRGTPSLPSAALEPPEAALRQQSTTIPPTTSEAEVPPPLPARQQNPDSTPSPAAAVKANAPVVPTPTVAKAAENTCEPPAAEQTTASEAAAVELAGTVLADAVEALPPFTLDVSLEAESTASCCRDATPLSVRQESAASAGVKAAVEDVAGDVIGDALEAVSNGCCQTEPSPLSSARVVQDAAPSLATEEAVVDELADGVVGQALEASSTVFLQTQPSLAASARVDYAAAGPASSTSPLAVSAASGGALLPQDTLTAGAWVNEGRPVSRRTPSVISAASEQTALPQADSQLEANDTPSAGAMVNQQLMVSRGSPSVISDASELTMLPQDTYVPEPDACTLPTKVPLVAAPAREAHTGSVIADAVEAVPSPDVIAAQSLEAPCLDLGALRPLPGQVPSRAWSAASRGSVQVGGSSSASSTAWEAEVAFSDTALRKLMQAASSVNDDDFAPSAAALATEHALHAEQSAIAEEEEPSEAERNAQVRREELAVLRRHAKESLLSAVKSGRLSALLDKELLHVPVAGSNDPQRSESSAEPQNPEQTAHKPCEDGFLDSATDASAQEEPALQQVLSANTQSVASAAATEPIAATGLKKAPTFDAAEMAGLMTADAEADGPPALEASKATPLAAAPDGTWAVPDASEVESAPNVAQAAGALPTVVVQEAEGIDQANGRLQTRVCPGAQLPSLVVGSSISCGSQAEWSAVPSSTMPPRLSTHSMDRVCSMGSLQEAPAATEGDEVVPPSSVAPVSSSGKATSDADVRLAITESEACFDELQASVTEVDESSLELTTQAAEVVGSPREAASVQAIPTVQEEVEETTLEVQSAGASQEAPAVVLASKATAPITSVQQLEEVCREAVVENEQLRQENESLRLELQQLLDLASPLSASSSTAPSKR